MTYIRIGSCVRTCSLMRTYLWPDAYVRVARCVRTHFEVFKNAGMIFMWGQKDHPLIRPVIPSFPFILTF